MKRVSVSELVRDFNLAAGARTVLSWSSPDGAPRAFLARVDVRPDVVLVARCRLAGTTYDVAFQARELAQIPCAEGVDITATPAASTSGTVELRAFLGETASFAGRPFPTRFARAAVAQSFSIPTARRVFRVQHQPAILAATYGMLFDAAALPANGTAPYVPLSTNGSGVRYDHDWCAAGGIPLVSGLVLAQSSTEPTLTVSSTAQFQAWYSE